MQEQLSIFDLMSEKDKKKYKPIKSHDYKWSFSDYPQALDINVFSCFAGGGGSTMGYKLAGCNVLGCVEIDKRMNELYLLNHNPKYNFLMDIRDFNKLSKNQIPKELFNLDILDGSPPCTTFSVAGLREETWGKKKKFLEGQTAQVLDELSFIFIDTVKKLKPKTVIMENVEGLLLGNAWSYVQRIYKEFSDAGYDVNHWLLYGEKMGVPQQRHRVFFIAIRKDIDFDLSKLDMYFNYEPVTYGEIQSGSGIEISHDTEAYRWLLKAEPQDKRLSDTIIRNGEHEKLYSYQVIWPDRIMQTLTAKGEVFRGKEKTRVSIEDMLLSTTFPIDYKFTRKSYRSVKYVCGMSVPPLMIKRVVLRLIESGLYDYTFKYM